MLKEKFVKLITLLIAFAMIIGSLAVPVFADEAEVSGSDAQIIDVDVAAEAADEYSAEPAAEDTIQSDVVQDYYEEQPVAAEPVPAVESVQDEVPAYEPVQDVVPAYEPVQEEVPAYDQGDQKTASQVSEDEAFTEEEQFTDVPEADAAAAAEELRDDTIPYAEVSEEDAELELEDNTVTSLDKPVIKSVNNTAEGTMIYWDEVNNAEKYNVYRAVKGGTWTRIGEAAGTVYIDASSVSTSGYYYGVTAVAGSVESQISDYIFNINIGVVKLSSCSPTANGILIQWNKLSGATKYAVYRKTGEDGEWGRLATVKNSYLYYEDKTAVNGKDYYYTVCAYITSGKTNYYGGYEYPGLSFTKLATPKLEKAAATANGIKVTWDAVAGAEGYIVFRKAKGGKWGVAGYATEAGYIDTNIKAGTFYYYTVIAYKGQSYSYYQSQTLKTYAVAKVSLSSVYNSKNGVTIVWSAVSNANGYYVYRRTDPSQKWTNIAKVTGNTYYVDTAAPTGTVYYTVRAYQDINNTRYGGMYEENGLGTEYIAAPKMGSATTNKNTPSITINWGAVTGAEKYNVYRKAAGASEWTMLTAVTGTSYTDTAIKTTTDYSYTVRAVSENGVLSGYDGSGIYVSFNPGPVLTSATGNPSGVLVKWKSFAGAEGYYVYRKVGNATSWTRIATTKNNYYVDINAKAGKNNTYTVRAYYHYNGKLTSSGYNKEGITCKYTDSVRIMAAERLAAVGGTLRAAYDWCANLKYKNRPNNKTASYYANIAFTYINGDCHTKAAAFCWMARELGYNAKVVDGYVELANGRNAVHGWVEVIIDGKTYIFDPEFQQEYPNLNGYKITYGQKNTWKYNNWKTMADY